MLSHLVFIIGSDHKLLLAENRHWLELNLGNYYERLSVVERLSLHIDVLNLRGIERLHMGIHHMSLHLLQISVKGLVLCVLGKPRGG